jgi:DNA-binding response OmpR family regulator
MSFLNVSAGQKFHDRPEPDRGAVARLLDSSTILVVEDETLIGLDVEGILRELGAVVWSAENVERARGLMSAAMPHAAVLDALLREGDSFTLARELVAAGVAVIFLTGYAPGIPDDLKHCPIIEKPFTPDDIAAGLAQVIRRRGAAD